MHKITEITINDLAALIIIAIWITGAIVLAVISLTMPESVNGVALVAVGWLFRGQTNGTHPVTNKPVSEVMP